MGRPPAPDAQTHRGRHAGRSSFPAWARARATSSSSCRKAAGRRSLKADPVGFQHEEPPATASIVSGLAAPRLGRCGMDGGAPARQALSAPISIYEVHLGSWRRGEGQSLPHLRRACRRADPLREGPGLHPHRVPARLRASLLRLVGLSADRAFRADQPLRTAGSLRPLRRPLPSGRTSASSSTGCRRISRTMLTASPASTARRSTSTKIRASASIRTGTR